MCGPSASRHGVTNIGVNLDIGHIARPIKVIGHRLEMAKSASSPSSASLRTGAPILPQPIRGFIGLPDAARGVRPPFRNQSTAIPGVERAIGNLIVAGYTCSHLPAISTTSSTCWASRHQHREVRGGEAQARAVRHEGEMADIELLVEQRRQRIASSPIGCRPPHRSGRSPASLFFAVLERQPVDTGSTPDLGDQRVGLLLAASSLAGDARRCRR